MSEDFVQQCCDKASAFFTQGNYDAAEKYLKKAIDRDPGNSKVLALISLLASARKNKSGGGCYCFVVLMISQGRIRSSSAPSCS